MLLLLVDKDFKVNKDVLFNSISDVLLRSVKLDKDFKENKDIICVLVLREIRTLRRIRNPLYSSVDDVY